MSRDATVPRVLKFDYQSLPWNIVFGVGALKRLPAELQKLKLSNALVLTTPEQTPQGNDVVELLGGLAAGLFDQAAMHVPATTVDQAIQEAKELNADCTVSIGGGSTTGLGKALALKMALPNIAIPTSYAGSEMTNIWGITEHGRKSTGRDNAVLPTLTLYDPELTLTMPPEFAGPSGMNALAQAVVNVATNRPNPIVASMALDAIRVLANGLPVVMAEPANIEARAEVLFGACLAGGSVGAGITSLHHRLCHVFGGLLNTPHAQTHAILLPHCVAYNAAATAEGTQNIAEAMGVPDAASGIFELARTVGAPTALSAIGIEDADLEQIVVAVMESPPDNPEPITETRLRALLENALHGRVPQPIE